MWASGGGKSSQVEKRVAESFTGKEGVEKSIVQRLGGQNSEELGEDGDYLLALIPFMESEGKQTREGGRRDVFLEQRPLKMGKKRGWKMKGTETWRKKHGELV